MPQQDKKKVDEAKKRLREQYQKFLNRKFDPKQLIKPPVKK